MTTPADIYHGCTPLPGGLRLHVIDDPARWPLVLLVAVHRGELPRLYYNLPRVLTTEEVARHVADMATRRLRDEEANRLAAKQIADGLRRLAEEQFFGGYWGRSMLDDYPQGPQPT